MNMGIAAKEGGIHLFVGKTNGCVPLITPIRWSIEELLLWEMKKYLHFGEPYLLLVVTQGPPGYLKEVDRRLIPLEQGMDFLCFARPGRYTIQAVILLERSQGSGSNLLQELVKKIGECSWQEQILAADGQFADLTSYDIWQSLGRGTVDVTVAKESFSGMLLRWRWKWVNWWYQTLPRDDRQFRRRHVVAFTVQPFAIVAWIGCLGLLRFTIALMLRFLLGLRGVNFYPAVSVFKERTSAVWRDCKHSVFLYDSHNHQRAWYSKLCQILTAPFEENGEERDWRVQVRGARFNQKVEKLSSLACRTPLKSGGDLCQVPKGLQEEPPLA